jgi:protein AroM
VIVMGLRRLGIVTMGQAPRDDVVPELRATLGDQVMVVEAGALDEATADEIASLAPRPGEPALASRLRDGRGVALAKDRLLPRVADAVRRVAAVSDAVLILCSGHFPRFEVPVPVYYPDRILRGIVDALLDAGSTLGLISPLPSQAEQASVKWQRPVLAAAASPYGPDALWREAARRLRQADLIVLDCMGCNRHHRELVAAETGQPVLLPSAAVARVLAEVL